MIILMGGGTEAIIKPVQDTSSGVGVEKIKGIEAIKNNLQEKAAKTPENDTEKIQFSRPIRDTHGNGRKERTNATHVSLKMNNLPCCIQRQSIHLGLLHIFGTEKFSMCRLH